MKSRTELFFDAGGPYPAQGSILFRRSAEIFLNLESIGIVGTLMTGGLIRRSAPNRLTDKKGS
jgi:hypothetical protein